MMKGIIFLFLSMALSVYAQDDSLDIYVPQHFMDWDCDMSTEDGFHVFAIEEFEDYSLVMFDKWGEIVWKSNDHSDYWVPMEDKSQELAEGVYFWRITYTLLEDVDFDGVKEKVEKEITGNTYYLKR
ncbi:MAG: gliding motility-associated C-terminal domain-containing protein [Crocinitomicaceae bacterium]